MGADGKPDMQVLVVDDNDVIHIVLSELLKKEGFSVNFCHSADVAINLSKQVSFHIYLIDYRLPEMKGDVLAGLLRKMQPTALIIGYSLEFKERFFISAGANKFILKERLLTDLVPLIKKLLAPPRELAS